MDRHIANPDQTLTVYYDKSCPVCRREIEGLDEATRGTKLKLVDCSLSAYADDHAEQDNISRKQMLDALHIRDAKGEWHSGIGAFSVLYRHVGLKRFGSLLSSKTLAPLLNGFYRWFARNRMAINRMFLPKLYVSWLTRRVRRLAQTKHQASSTDGD
ncbi:MAG: DUF393 domain-containing protein [Pseudomonadota bacterium]